MEASTIKELFGRRNVRFEIPSYQRAYAWGKQQLTQFLEDLKDCAGRDYYLGHFLFEQDEDTLYVIDGQQRLTTCVIFLSAVYKILKAKEGDWINTNKKEIIERLQNDIRNNYLISSMGQRFATVGYDNEFFVNIIINHNENYSNETLTSKSKILIGDALKLFKEELNKIPIDLILSYVSSLEKASITTFVVKDKTQACQIFAYQNDRGKKLSNLEILKVYFVLQIYRYCHDNKLCESYIYDIEKLFEEIYHLIVLISVDEDTVLNYCWQSFSEKGYNSNDVVKEVKEWVDSRNEMAVCLEIKYFIMYLLLAFNTVKEIEEDDSLYATNLKNLDNMSLAYPILIKAKLANVEDEVFKRLIKLMENVTFRWLVIGGRAKIHERLQRVFWCKDYGKNFERMIHHVKAYINNEWWYWRDECLWDKLGDVSFYGTRVDNYVLWRYEQYLCNKNKIEIKIQYSDVASSERIDHIAPRDGGILRFRGYGSYHDSNEWMDKIGNIVLKSKRQKRTLGGGSHAFIYKLDIYSGDNILQQQQEIAEFVSNKENPVWNKVCINKRTEKIIEAAKEIWDLDKI